MAVNYPESWIARVQSAPKLTLQPGERQYRSPDGRLAVGREEVARLTEAYLREEARRRRLRKLSKDDERICQDFVLLVDNWRTGRWNVPTAPLVWAHGPKPKPRIRSQI